MYERDPQNLGREQNQLRQLTDPIRVLKTQTVMSEHRATYAANLSSAGPHELDALAKESIMNGGNKALGSAVVTAIDNLSTADRKLLRVSRTELADALVGQEVKATKRALLEVDLVVRRARIVNWELEDLNPRKVTQERTAVGVIDVRMSQEHGIGQSPLSAWALRDYTVEATGPNGKNMPSTAEGA